MTVEAKVGNSLEAVSKIPLTLSLSKGEPVAPMMARASTGSARAVFAFAKKLLPSFFLTFAIFLLPFSFLHASGVDAFLAEGGGARAQGMGGVQTALSEDLSALLANPAGLASVSGKALAAYYAPSPLQTESLFAAYGCPMKSVYFAAGAFQRKVSDIELTDSSGDPLGSKAFTDQAAFLSVAGGASIPLGLTLKYLQSQFKPYDVSGVGADLGAKYIHGPYRAGVTWQDFGGTELSGKAYAGGSTGSRIPSRLRLGVAFEPWSVNVPAVNAPSLSGVLAADALLPLGRGESTTYFLGGEVWSCGRLALRAGWNGDRGWSTGMSINLSRVRFDYAIVLSENAPAMSRLTTHYFFGGKS